MIKRSLILTSIFLIILYSLTLKEERYNFGIVLIGGKHCPEAVQWILDRTKNKKILVLSSDNVRMEWLSHWENNIDFLSVPTREFANSDIAVNKILEAEAILISGGIQKDYIDLWKGTRFAAAINYMSKRIIISGTSAGLAILGEYYYSADNDTVISSEALADPYNIFMSSINNEFLNIPYMGGLITDSHYYERGRLGRHLSFMARILNDFKLFNIKGIGVDEYTALCINSSGIAKVVGKGKCYLLENISLPEICIAGHCLKWPNAVKAYVLSEGNLFNIKKWKFPKSESWSVCDGKLLRN